MLPVFGLAVALLLHRPAQAGPVAAPALLPPGTPLWVRSGDRATPMRVGQAVQGSLMYPVYIGNEEHWIITHYQFGCCNCKGDFW